MLHRCDWVTEDPLYMKYHDQEWGVPVYDDSTLYEFLLLESFQAGLSWITVLKKREHFRTAFDQFNYHRIALYEEDKIISLLKNAGIIRHRKKIEAAIHNAKQFIQIQNEWGSFSNYLWQFTDKKIIVNCWETTKEVPATTTLSDTVAKDLKLRGFKFLGSTTVYAYLQAVGVVNDHITSCFCHPHNA